MTFRSIFPLLLAATLSACAQPGPQAAGVPALTEASVTAIANLAIHDSADRRVLQVLDPLDWMYPITTTIPTTTTTTTTSTAPGVTPWTADDIDHVKLALYKGATSVATLTVGKADLAKSVRFTHLIRNTGYTVEARAWSDAAETHAIDNAEVAPTTCKTTFTTATADSITIGDLQLRLKDKTFSGSTTGSSLVVTDGEVVDTTATSAIELQ